MSVTFYPAKQDGESIRPIGRCDCDVRYCNACDVADSLELPYPDRYHCDVCDHELNLNNRNAADLIRWLGMDVFTLWSTEYGHCDAKELAARCRRRLWDEPRNYDVGLDTSHEETVEGGARLIECGRDPGYLRHTVGKLLKIAERAGDNLVAWG